MSLIERNSWLVKESYDVTMSRSKIVYVCCVNTNII